MHANATTARFLKEDDNEIWSLILANDISQVREKLTRQTTNKGFFGRFFSKSSKDKETNKFTIILLELLDASSSKTLDEADLTIISDDNSTLFRNLLKLLFSLDENDQQNAIKEKVLKRLFHSVQPIAAVVETEANGYPANPITALTWAYGSKMRDNFGWFAHYFEQKRDKESQFHVQWMRTSITLCIMSHYKAMVGPDMIAMAKLQEEVGRSEEALQAYKAVIADFENELQYFKDNPEAETGEDDILILNFLLIAYTNADRMLGVKNHQSQIEHIQKLL